jgi:hypothetical protein
LPYVDIFRTDAFAGDQLRSIYKHGAGKIVVSIQALPAAIERKLEELKAGSGSNEPRKGTSLEKGHVWEESGHPPDP